MMSTEVKTSQLIINKLTKEQYEAIVSPSETEIYLTPDESVQAGDNISILNNDAGYQTASDVSSAISTAIENKQDVIEDLETIRSGASLGATALQSFTESDPTVPTHVKSITEADITSWNNKSSFSGSYNDLTDKPTNVSQFNNDSGYITSSYHDDTKQNLISDLEDIRSNATDGKSAKDILDEIVPEQASSTNQLADKDFVNSSVSTNTAYFKGTFDTLEELEAVEGATNNDYGFVKTTDESGNKVFNRYKYNGSAWVFEYSLNNSSFTSSQWSSINSNITSDKVVEYDNHIDDNTIHITEEERGIWNAKSDFSGDYNDLDNKPTIPTVNDSTITIKQGETVKGSFTLNQDNDTTITLDLGSATSRIAEIHGTLSTTTNEIVLSEAITRAQIISLNLGNTIILPELYSLNEDNTKIIIVEPIEENTKWSLTYVTDMVIADIPMASSTKAGLVKLDTVPTEGSDNAITSGAVYALFHELETILHNINSGE